MNSVHRYIKNRFCKTTVVETPVSASVYFPGVKRDWQIPNQKISNFTGKAIYMPAISTLANIDTYKVGKHYKTQKGYTICIIGKDTHTIEVLANLAMESARMNHKTFIDLMTITTPFEELILYGIKDASKYI